MHIGIDLAWGLKQPTGLAVLDDTGRLVHVSAVRTDEQIETALAPFTAGPCIVAIDAPLVVTNATGNRAAERALNAEMDHHLAGEEAGNTRNGYGRKTVTTETGRIELAIPRDRQATFDPQLIAKYQRRFPGFDDKIVSMYARGMSAREIVGHLRELYGIEVSPDLVSAVTDAVLEEIAAWQARPLEPRSHVGLDDRLQLLQLQSQLGPTRTKSETPCCLVACPCHEATTRGSRRACA